MRALSARLAGGLCGARLCAWPSLARLLSGCAGLLSAIAVVLPAAADVYLSESAIEIAGTGPRASRNCTITFKPAQTTGGDLAPRLVLTTSGLTRLSVGIDKASQYSSPVIVQNNLRRPFLSGDNITVEQFGLSDVAKALKARRLFFLTAQRVDTGKFVSGRFEAIDYDAVLTRAEAFCPFDAESLMSDLSSRQRAEQSLSITPTDMTHIRWALNKRYGGRTNKPDLTFSLLQPERGYLRQYTADNGLSVSQYLTAETARRLSLEGQLIAIAALPSTPPPPWPPPPAAATTTPWPPLPPGPKQSFWSHKGSRVSLKAEAGKPSRIFVFDAPSDDLKRGGVTSGTTLFKGVRTRDRYSGTASDFWSSCPAAAYEVTGFVSEDQRHVTLQGSAPVRGPGCKVLDRRNETLTFIFHDALDNWGEAR